MQIYVSDVQIILYYVRYTVPRVAVIILDWNGSWPPHLIDFIWFGLITMQLFYSRKQKHEISQPPFFIRIIVTLFFLAKRYVEFFSDRLFLSTKNEKESSISVGDSEFVPWITDQRECSSLVWLKSRKAKKNCRTILRFKSFAWNNKC